ncbi:unnamed protein product [Lampetra fluviatilis]
MRASGGQVIRTGAVNRRPEFESWVAANTIPVQRAGRAVPSHSGQHHQQHHHQQHHHQQQHQQQHRQQHHHHQQHHQQQHHHQQHHQ